MQPIIDFLNEYLRINAIKRLWGKVSIRKSEIFFLVLFAFLFAAFEGVGLSLLLPVLQYAESGESAITNSTGAVWTILHSALSVLNIPINLATLLILAFVPILLRQVIYYVRAWYSSVVAGKMAIRARMKVIDTIYNSDWAFFIKYPAGQIVNVIIGLSAAGGAALLALINYFSVLLLIVLYAAILFMLSVPLTLCALFFALLVIVVSKANIRRIGRYSKTVSRRSQEMMGKIVERVGLIHLVKLRNQEKEEKKFIEDFSYEMYEISVKQARLSASIEVISDPILMVSVFITLFIGIAVFGLSLAQLGLLMFILTRLNSKVKELNSARQGITNAMANVSLLNEMETTASELNTIHSGSKSVLPLAKGIEFRDVTFDFVDDYSAEGELLSKGKKVVKNLSIDIPAGSFVAFVGRSGAGKSTIVGLLTRLREVSGGEILFDGVNIKEFKLGELRRSIGFLKQTAMLFNDSIYENLIYGLGRIPSDAEIEKVLKDAYADFVFDLPMGLETKLGDSGVRFSGGEQQRLALARVLLEDTDIVILDEPTSALDSESERFIQESLARLHGKKTVIVIAHRLATVMQADTLFVIDDGQVVESGTHQELIANGGAYTTLFESQLNGMIN